MEFLHVASLNGTANRLKKKDSNYLLKTALRYQTVTLETPSVSVK